MQPPVKEQTKATRGAAVRYWRASGRISVKEDHGDKAPYFEGRRLLKSSEVNKVVFEEFERTKGSGVGKLACSLRDNFLGVSRAEIQTILWTKVIIAEMPSFLIRRSLNLSEPETFMLGTK